MFILRFSIVKWIIYHLNNKIKPKNFLLSIDFYNFHEGVHHLEWDR